MFRYLILLLCVSTLLAAPQNHSDNTLLAAPQNHSDNTLLAAPQNHSDNTLLAAPQNHSDNTLLAAPQNHSNNTLLAAPQNHSNNTLVTQQTRPQPEVIQTSKTPKNGVLVQAPAISSTTVKENSKKAEVEQNEPTNTPLYNYSDRIYSIKTTPKKKDNSIKNRPTTPVETVSSSSTVSSTDTRYIPDLTTTKNTIFDYDEKSEELESTTAVWSPEGPIAKILPKLSHYGKSTLSWFSNNLILTTGIRQFRSKCRCEKIWNCAKLQISVPRCPEEYFLCCS